MQRLGSSVGALIGVYARVWGHFGFRRGQGALGVGAFAERRIGSA